MLQMNVFLRRFSSLHEFEKICSINHIGWHRLKLNNTFVAHLRMTVFSRVAPEECETEWTALLRSECNK